MPKRFNIRLGKTTIETVVEIDKKKIGYIQKINLEIDMDNLQSELTIKKYVTGKNGKATTDIKLESYPIRSADLDITIA